MVTITQRRTRYASLITTTPDNNITDHQIHSLPSPSLSLLSLISHTFCPRTATTTNHKVNIKCCGVRERVMPCYSLLLCPSITIFTQLLKPRSHTLGQSVYLLLFRQPVIQSCRSPIPIHSSILPVQYMPLVLSMSVALINDAALGPSPASYSTFSVPCNTVATHQCSSKSTSPPQPPSIIVCPGSIGRFSASGIVLV